MRWVIKKYVLECMDRSGKSFKKEVRARSHTQAVIQAHADKRVFAVKATKYETIRG